MLFIKASDTTCLFVHLSPDRKQLAVEKGWLGLYSEQGEESHFAQKTLQE